jgi:lipoic acid synthetase
MTAAEGIPKPAWLRRRLVSNSSSDQVRALLRGLDLHTVCQEAHCPNQAECFGRGTATFLILGDRCTRSCTFCAVRHEPQEAPDPGEPERLAEAVARLGLSYVVITSVTRDDLVDGGASHFASTVTALRAARPEAMIELLVPDLQGSLQALQTILDVRPSVLNHNVETVPRLYSAVRPQADYRRSFHLLAAAKRLNPQIVTKSGLMVGLGERPGEVSALLADLRETGCDLLTIGQYLRPSREHHPVMEYIHPQRLEAYAREAEALGFLGVAAGPYVRSSYQAADLYRQALGFAKV